jgi:hypothetical protein
MWVAGRTNELGWTPSALITPHALVKNRIKTVLSDPSLAHIYRTKKIKLYRVAHSYSQ